MLGNPMDVLEQFPVRKTKKQKQMFRNAVSDWLSRNGYGCREESGSLGARNLVIGDPEKAKFLITAHYDTCAGMLVPNLITPCNVVLFVLYQLVISAVILLPAVLLGIAVGWLTDSFFVGQLVFLILIWVNIALLLCGPANPRNANDNTSGVVTLLEIAGTLPENQRDKVCFVLFDLEELGVIGSASYRKAHKAQVEKQIILNMDCVGDGNEILLFPTGKLKKDPQKMALLRTCCGIFGEKRVSLFEKGLAVYPSDQSNFPYGVGICALRKGKLALYLSRIHTARDTVLDQTNVNILRAALTSLVSRSQGE